MAYVGILFLRCLVPIGAVAKYTCTKVCNKQNNKLRELDYADNKNEDGLTSEQV